MGSGPLYAHDTSPPPVEPRSLHMDKGDLAKALKETGLALKDAGGETSFSVRRPVMALLGTKPMMANDAFVAPSASVIGAVTLMDRSSVW